MLVIADPAHARAHTETALAIVAQTADVRARRWATSLYNNFGWRLHDDGHPREALDEFHSALASAQPDEQSNWCRHAIVRCLRTLGRDDEARAMKLQLDAANDSAAE